MPPIKKRAVALSIFIHKYPSGLIYARKELSVTAPFAAVPDRNAGHSLILHVMQGIFPDPIVAQKLSMWYDGP